MRRARPKLKYENVLPDDQKDSPWYNAIEVGYAWFEGFKPELYWKNTTECFDRLTNFTYGEIPALNVVLEDVNKDGQEQLNETLYLVRNFSTHLWFCNNAWNSSSYYWAERIKAYEGVGHFFLSMLQNFLGEVISLTNIYISIESNMAENNPYGVHYDSARLMRAMIVFDPVELVDRDINFNPNSGDADSLPDPDSAIVPDLFNKRWPYE